MSNPIKPARVVREPAAAVRPLFPTSRLLKSCLHESEQQVRAAGEEIRRTRDECAQMRLAALAECDVMRAQAASQIEAELRLVREQGRAEARARYEVLLKSFDDELRDLMKNLPREVELLALGIAREIIDVEFQLRPDAIVDLVASALQRARLCREVCAVVSLSDYPLVAPMAEELQRQLIAVERFSVRADAALPVGSVRLETDRGVLDGSCATRFSRIALAVAAAAENPATENADRPDEIASDAEVAA